jgi:hypothetical protein
VIARTLYLCCLLCLRPLAAQPSSIVSRGDRYIGAWIGFSPDSRVAQFREPKRRLLAIGAHAEWVIESSGNFSLAANSDLIPVVVITRTPTYVTRDVMTPGGGIFQTNEQTGSKPVYGAGISPFGFKLRIGSSPRIRFFGASSVGGLWFTRNVPVPDARRFNFTFEYGGGIEAGGARQRTITIGYKFHHLSNANSAAFNPGLDSDVLYIGVSRAR